MARRNVTTQIQTFGSVYITWPTSARVCNILFYIHGSAHRNSILIGFNKTQQYAGIYLLRITLHVSGVYRTHHQEYIKL